MHTSIGWYFDVHPAGVIRALHLFSTNLLSTSSVLCAANASNVNSEFSNSIFLETFLMYSNQISSSHTFMRCSSIQAYAWHFTTNPSGIRSFSMVFSVLPVGFPTTTLHCSVFSFAQIVFRQKIALHTQQQKCLTIFLNLFLFKT